MEFFIRQNSELPILIMEIVNDGRTQSHLDFSDMLDNATIRFSMKRVSDGVQTIFMNNAYITEKIQQNPDAPTEYYIFYRWQKRDTRMKGRFIGEFSVITEAGELIAPIRENLYINIT